MSRLVPEELGGHQGQTSEWIEQNHPENGLFRVYWKDADENDSLTGGITFDENEGEGLRYEWYYKDGKRADGISRSWWSNGQLKQITTWKNDKKHGTLKGWIPTGQKYREEKYTNGSKNGLFTTWYSNGQKKNEITLNYGKEDGVFTEWYMDGQKKMEERWIRGKDPHHTWKKPPSIKDGKWTYWNEKGQKDKEIIYKNGKLISEEQYNNSSSFHSNM